MKMPGSVKEALTRSGGLIADEGARSARYPAREISSLIFFGARSKLMGAWGYRDTVDVIRCYAHHYNANRTASRDATTATFLELVDRFPGSMKTGREISCGF